jgi:hypothetical protein
MVRGWNNWGLTLAPGKSASQAPFRLRHSAGDLSGQAISR